MDNARNATNSAIKKAISPKTALAVRLRSASARGRWYACGVFRITLGKAGWLIVFDIPGFQPIEVEHLLLDYNGTIAKDGIMPESVRSLIARLSEKLQVTVLTADTHGTVRAQCEGLDVHVETFPRAGAAQCKRDYAQGLQGGAACLGNGFNDILMFDECALSIAVMDAEGACAKLIPHADILVRSMEEGLEMLLVPDRVRATLRS